MLQPTASTPSRPGSSRRRNPLATRRGTIALAAGIGLIAAVVLVVFFQQYRTALIGSDRVQVLVARTVIPRGTSGQLILDEKAYRMATVRRSELKGDGIVDPNRMVHLITLRELYPGHQLDERDFQHAAGTAPSRLARYQRAITVPVDAARGMTSEVRYGDRVDVIRAAGGPSAAAVGASGAQAARLGRVLSREALVLRVEPEVKGGGLGGSGTRQTVTLRVDDGETAAIAAAASEKRLWLVLRPPLGARSRASVRPPASPKRGDSARRGL